MPSFDEIREEIISFFLTEFPNDHAIAYVESVVKDYLLLSYAPEWVEDFWEKSGHRVLDDLTKEHTRRIRDNLQYILDSKIATELWSEDGLTPMPELIQQSSKRPC